MPLPVPWLALDLARPLGAWAFLLPPLLLVLARLLERPPGRVVGTLRIWKEVAAASPRSGAGRRARVPPWAWWLAAALACGALALAGPRGPGAPRGRTWTLVLDASPSMRLPVRPGGPTRLEAALGAALGWLSGESRARDRVRWLAPGREPLELARGERPPPAWMQAEAGLADEPDWALFDRPGALWVTDREPALAREHAGSFASGGAAVPGPIAADGRETVVWDGERLVSAPAEPRAVFVEGGELAPVILRVLRAWCEARGFLLRAARGTDRVLTLEAPRGSAEAVLAVRCGRDGWQADGVASGEGAGPPAGASTLWLEGRDDLGESVALVRASRGRIRIALRELSEPRGDPAAFALSWGRLLDRCALPALGVAPLVERLEAGPAVNEPGSAPADAPASGRERGPLLDAALAFVSALLGFAGLAGLRRRTGSGPAGSALGALGETAPPRAAPRERRERQDGPREEELPGREPQRQPGVRRGPRTPDRQG